MTDADEKLATKVATSVSTTRPADGASRDVGSRTGATPAGTETVKAPQARDALAGTAPVAPPAGGTGRGSTLHPDAIAAVMGANHGDPFAILGPHKVAEGRWEIRAILPEAKSATLLVGGRRVPFEKLHPDGFFVASIESPGRPLYELAIELWDGSERNRYDPYSFGSSLNQHDIDALREIGSNVTYRVLGAHQLRQDGTDGFRFAVWAPNARKVSVVGDFNEWDGRRHPMRLWQNGGVWELFIPGLKSGQCYKYEIRGPDGSLLPLKADPVAFRAQHPPETASVLQGGDEPVWHDKAWMASRGERDPRHVAMSIYEVHMGSWMRVPEEGNRYLTYKELGERLIPYVKELGFTHIEMLPVTEFPFDGSWGYQAVSLFAPTSRFGTPDEFVEFVNTAHEAGIGVLLDWVPGHFPLDAHAHGLFDGTHLYEHADPRQGFHQDWGTYIYNFGRSEVSTFLAANARFWLEHYHLDGLRVDAVASMLYLDYSRRAGEWIPNQYGGNENLDAIHFLRKTNEATYSHAPGTITVAEESTSWPGVSHPTYTGGLGFGFKWNMGWMHDTLKYISEDPIHRRYHHHNLTFGLLYAFSENFILPLSHDEVVHGKGSLLGKMPGDHWQKFANLRAYFGFMWGHPGKKLLFMGGEFGQEREWNHNQSLDWHLLDAPHHRGVKDLVHDLNHAYRATPALYERDFEPAGFQWLVADDQDNSVIAWARKGKEDGAVAIVVSNFTPIPRENYRIGVPAGGYYREAINSDSERYGGSNVGNHGGLHAEQQESHGQGHSLSLTLPPLATLILVREG
ncbi:1,4-alpha-glucan branching protein GlgB [Methylobacterium gnaphalii]|uniref:1,4-alpha-glucan branching enzyme GlgB n=1 Tax=Methylobacterium gnaphalii TaxID=1010610 RepID=A0A512JNX2_9HYPH|nr:1,4-alpha-glucan branching protein GlgB [Methylobacterium gnaphalii]GEP11563.1 1,4-alpha-glucan branching enzyme GlgB [Methylobacterium gnaphalii]GJD70304.1 1,4-alpha-glucan branching enzyme GlgB [Methylobacterium gnaphalii]GLS48810.1 1,4-alpha-glucan branching enzyme GlgB [Methylobacterium gnaphalii]